MLSSIKPYRSKMLAAVATLLILVAPYTALPGLTGLNEPQLKTVLILILATLLWASEWVPLFLVSFIILALELVWLSPSVIALGINVSDSQFFAPFFSNIILLFLGGFVLSSTLQKASLDGKFANWILSITKGEPAITLFGIICACAFLSMWMSNTATTAMMIALVLPLIKRLPADAPFRISLVLSIPLACNLGGIGTPIGTPPNAIALSYLAANGIEISFLKWMTLTTPFLIVALFILWLSLLKIYPPNNIKLERIDADPEPFNGRQWLTIAIFAITVLGWLIGGQFGLKTGTVALFPIIAAFWFGLLDQSDFRSLPWDVLFLVAGGIALGVAIDITDLGEVIVAALPISSSFTLLATILIIVTAVLGTIMSNTATAALLIPLVFSLNLPVEQLTILILAITLNCSTAMVLPVSTPPNAIAFSSGVINVVDLARVGFLMAIIGIIVGLSVGPLYWYAIL